MNELILNFLTWAALLVLATEILLRSSKGQERKRVLIPAVLIVLTMGYVLGWAVSEGNTALAIATFVSGGVLIHLYYRHAGRRHILQDERTLRIEEIASRRTLQVTMLGLAILSVYLSSLQRKNPEVKLASEIVSAVLIALFVLHLGFLSYYRRVM
ncbi:DUF2178 domain-containing protein [Thermococcus sp.]|uniref:DUF2178 domain-containing protein n=1 Tax=Thermococcus sp. TaxID=35749 RepID=UPI002624CB97|nr:DUF2178 domain-containing protein [Thermococcus sp.]